MSPSTAFVIGLVVGGASVGAALVLYYAETQRALRSQLSQLSTEIRGRSDALKQATESSQVPPTNETPNS